MSKKRYNLIFRGEIAPNRSREAVKRRFAALFQVDRKAVEPLFSGKPVILKHSADLQLIRKCRAAFEEAGAICYMKPFKASRSNDSDLWN
jgi:hypothetical protein